MAVPYSLKVIGKVLTHWKSLRAVLWRNIYVKGYLPFVMPKRQARYVEKLRSKDHVNVVFLPTNVAMWKYQRLYELLKSDKRFRVYIFPTPLANFTREQRIEDLRAMRAYFSERAMEYVDYELEKGKPMVNVRDVVDPDIIFYTQHYEITLEKGLVYTHFLDKLLCYAPYAFIPRKMNLFYGLPFDYVAWRLYYQTELNKKYAKSISTIMARNVVVAGYTGASSYFTPPEKEVWKSDGRRKKRVIWAPHFTIVDGLGYFQASYFLKMAGFMCELAAEYADRVSFAFKPHPRLFSVLCNYPEWGKVKAREYYDFWANGANTQLETGDFVDLFKESDAMIHDCGSFIVDYMYFGKPILYDNPNIDDVKATTDELGAKAYDAHYRVKTLSDVKTFIDDVVLGGNDTMESVRKTFFEEYLKPKDGKDASQVIYDDIVKSIWG